MNQSSDFDNLNPQSLFDGEFTVHIDERPILPILHAVFSSPDFTVTQRRERIDSEDFSLPQNPNNQKRDLDFFITEFQVTRVLVTEEKPSRKRSSVVGSPEPTLLQLEVK